MTSGVPIQDAKLRAIAAASRKGLGINHLKRLFRVSDRTVRRALTLYAPQEAVRIANRSRPAHLPPLTIDDIRGREAAPAPDAPPPSGPLMAALRDYRDRNGRLPPHVGGMPRCEAEAALALAMAARAHAGLLDEKVRA